jgi:hypothetical protein
MTGTELASCAAEGRIAAAMIAIPLPPDEHRYETYHAALWIAAMVRLGEMLNPTEEPPKKRARR